MTPLVGSPPTAAWRTTNWWSAGEQHQSPLSRLSDLLFGPVACRAAERWSPSLGVPGHFLEVLLLVEDKRFPLHFGVDPLAIARAALRNVNERELAEGASTITQQLFDIQRGPLALRSPTWRRKFHQAAWAVKAELRTGKRDILQNYLGTVYWGRAYFGLKEAALGYFDRPVLDLSRTESFFLAERLGSPNAPSLSRIASILSRPAIKCAVLVETNDWRLLAEHYERAFGMGEGLWQSLEKFRKR
jgi:membrane carboxypeptidase/penicillin-binding protein PbpC